MLQYARTGHRQNAIVGEDQMKRTLLSPRSWASRVLAIILASVCVIPGVGLSQTPKAQPSPSVTFHPVPLRHLYLHFLIFQNVLNMRAAEESSQGKDGTPLRNSLQNMVGFSDADYAPIQSAATELASELKTLDAQAATIRAAGPSASATAQLKNLAAQREAYIDAEILALKEALPPNKITALETFITEFFAPKKLAVHVTSH